MEQIPDLPVVGAVRALAPHPSNAAVLYAATVNGGVWRTENATDATPHWRPLTDDQPSLSMGAIEHDPTDPAGRTLLAGMGLFSSLAGQGGAQADRLLRTQDDGAHWTPIADPLFAGASFTAVAPRGPVLLAASRTDVGLVRREGPASPWRRISGAATSRLPAGAVLDLAGHAKEPARLYCVLKTGGVFRSDDTGATWTPIRPLGSIGNARLSVAATGRLYLAVVETTRLSYVGYADVPTGPAPVWKAMDVPSVHPGDQGDLHFSLVAHPSDASLVIVGGDRQERPSSIGATDFTAQIWLGSVSVAPSGSWPSRQWRALTHDQAAGSAPHADSRDLAVDARGRLLECDDGGVYARPDVSAGPTRWISLLGDLACSELHEVDYDPRSHVLFGACQDTGTPYQLLAGGTLWATMPSQIATLTGDGSVAGCDSGRPGATSYRYVGWPNLERFVRQEWSAANARVSEQSLGSSLYAAMYAPDFYPALRINALAATSGAGRFILGGSNGLYEADSDGATIQRITAQAAGDGLGQDPIAYGGRRGGAENPDVLWFGSRRGAKVYVRTGPPPAPAVATATYPGGAVRSLVLDPQDWARAFVTDGRQVLTSPDAGRSWSLITGDLATSAGRDVWALAFVEGACSRGLVAGTGGGVFVSFAPWNGTWIKLGQGLPNALARTLVVAEEDDVLVAGTMGRGAWVLRDLRRAVDGLAGCSPP